MLDVMRMTLKFYHSFKVVVAPPRMKTKMSRSSRGYSSMVYGYLQNEL